MAQALTAIAAQKKEVTVPRTGRITGAYSYGGSALGLPGRDSNCTALMQVTTSPLHWKKWPALPARQRPGFAGLHDEVAFLALLLTFLPARTRPN